ncbi:MAG: HNH endonuclease [Elusimicrobia bacterium]|nr:HNH endonuclease [Elusimicrobiota bacterium]
MPPRKWDLAKLQSTVENSTSVAQVIKKLGLLPAGGNYVQLKKYIRVFRLNISHFKGHAWNKGMRGTGRPHSPLEAILVKGNSYQSFKLKKRLLAAGLKPAHCEQCGWAQKNAEGYLPLELDHINGDRFDNRLQNLRVLCPNCHSLQSTHRGRNIRKRLRMLS